MLQPRKHNLLTRLLNLPCKEHLIQNRIDLVEIKHQIQLANIAEELIQDFHKEMYSLQISQLVIVGVNASAEEQARVAPVDYL